MAIPFSLEFCIIFIEFSEKSKLSKNSWQVGKCPGHLFLKFLDPHLVSCAQTCASK